MLCNKRILAVAILLLIVLSCHKKNENPLSHISSMAGMHVWEGIRTDFYSPYSSADTSYSITFINTIYVLNDTAVTYSDSLFYWPDTLHFVSSITLTNTIAFSRNISSGVSPVDSMFYNYSNNTFTWVRSFPNSYGAYSSFEVHSP